MTRFQKTGMRAALLTAALAVCLGNTATLHPAPPSPTPSNPTATELGTGIRPDIYVEENGKMHVAWMNGNTLYYRYHNGSSWESTQTPDIDGKSIAQKSPPSVWADSNGKPHIVWADDDNHHVWYINKTGGSWSSPYRVVENTSGPDDVRLRDTHIAVASDGTRHVVWRHNSHVTGKGTIWYKKYANGSWGSKTQISEGSGTAKRPHLALGSNDALHVVWRQRGGPDNAYEVMYRKWNGSWDSVEYATYTSARAGEDPHVAVDNSNDPHVSFPEDDDAAYVKRNGANNWTNVVTLGTGEDPVIAIDDNGVIYVVWDNVYRYNSGSGWAGSQTYASGGHMPDAYGDGQYAHIVYEHPDDNSVRYTAVSDGGSPPPEDWITVTDPNGGENWQVGTSHSITWTSSGGIDNVKIRYSTNGGSNWTTIVESTANDGSYSWTVPDTPTEQAKVRIVDTGDTGVYDVSDGNFTISDGGGGDKWITVTDPNGGEVWEPGSSMLITWESSEDFEWVWIDYSTDSGQSWITIASRSSNDGDRNWNIPDTPSENCRLRIRNKYDFSVSDMSDRDFTIGDNQHEKWVRVVNPNGGETLTTGSTYTVTWDSSDDVDNVKLRYSTDDGSSWTTIVESTNNDGSYAWSVPSTPSNSCRIRVIDTGDTSVYDISDGSFSITEGGGGDSWITVTSPNGGEVWEPGSNQLITWESSNDFEYVWLDYSTDGGQSWIKIASRSSNDGDRNWNIPYTESDDCRLRIRNKDDLSIGDMSDRSFTIGEGGGGGDSWISITYPNGGEVMEPGTATHITWNSSGDFPYVWVDYSTDGGQSWIKIASRTANDGIRDWTVPDTQSGSCRMRIRHKDDFSVSDISDDDFTIGYSAGRGGKWISLRSRTDGAEWQVGTTRTIEWNASENIEGVSLWGSVDSGNTWILLAGSAPNTGSYSFTVPNIPTEHARVKVQDILDGRVQDTSEQDFVIMSDGSSGLTLQDGSIPKAFELHQNYPNPFNPSTEIRFDIPGEQGAVVPAVINIYDARGRLVRSLLDDALPPGSYRVHWDGRSDRGERLTSGIYLLYLKAGSNAQTMKMVLAR